jgi:Uma2 family endonuclease
MAYFAPLGVRLADHDMVEPDLVYVSNERAAAITARYIAGAPDLVVEALSPSTWRRDLGSKRARYELLGVREYWVLDPERGTATVFRRDGSAFLTPVLLSAEAGDRLTTPLLPGLEIPLAQVFPGFRSTAS